MKAAGIPFPVFAEVHLKPAEAACEELSPLLSEQHEGDSTLNHPSK